MVHFQGKKKGTKKLMKPLPLDTRCGMINQHNIDVSYKKSKQIKETDVFDKKASKKSSKGPDKPRVLPDKNKTSNAYS